MHTKRSRARIVEYVRTAAVVADVVLGILRSETLGIAPVADDAWR
jgi:hypothetical protein